MNRKSDNIEQKKIIKNQNIIEKVINILQRRIKSNKILGGLAAVLMVFAVTFVELASLAGVAFTGLNKYWFQFPLGCIAFFLAWAAFVNIREIVESVLEYSSQYQIESGDYLKETINQTDDNLKTRVNQLENIVEKFHKEQLDSALLTKYSIEHFLSNKDGAVVKGLNQGFNHIWRLQKGGIIPALTDFSQEFDFSLVPSNEVLTANDHSILDQHQINGELRNWHWLRVKVKTTYKLPLASHSLPSYLTCYQLIRLLLQNPGLMSFEEYVAHEEDWANFNIEPYYPLPQNAFYMYSEGQPEVSQPDILAKNILAFRSVNFINGYESNGATITKNRFKTHIKAGSYSFEVEAKPLYDSASPSVPSTKVSDELERSFGKAETERLISMTNSKEFINLYVHFIQRDRHFTRIIENKRNEDWSISSDFIYIVPMFAEFTYVRNPEVPASGNENTHILLQDTYESPVGRLAQLSSVDGTTNPPLFYAKEAPMTLYSFLPLEVKIENKDFGETQFVNHTNAVPKPSAQSIFLYPTDVILFRFRGVQTSKRYADAMEKLLGIRNPKTLGEQ